MLSEVPEKIDRTEHSSKSKKFGVSLITLSSDLLVDFALTAEEY